MSTPYATADELYAQPNVTVPDESGTVELMLAAASMAIDGFCNREVDGFVALDTASPRLFVGTGLVYQQVNEFVELESVDFVDSLEDNTWSSISVSNFQPYIGSGELPEFNRIPYNGLMIVRGGVGVFPNGSGAYAWDTGFGGVESARNVPTVRINARWGYAATIPPAVKQATITLAARWLKRGQSFWADTAGSDSMGMLLYKQALDPDVKMMLQMARLVRPTYGD